MVPRYLRRLTDGQRGVASAAAMVPRYQRRLTDDQPGEDADVQPVTEFDAAAALANMPPPPALWKIRDILPRIDAATPELRRRVFEVRRAAAAQPRERLPLNVIWSLVAGLSIALSLGIGNLVFGG
jgi:hypothetical protein